MSPAAFVRNVGQVSYTSGRPASHVDGVFTVGGTTAFVHSGGMHFVQRAPSKSVQSREQEPKQTASLASTAVEFDMYRTDMVLIGSNSNARLEWLEEADGFSRFLNAPSDNAQGRIAHHYNKLYYHEVWPGIDMRVFVVDGGMEYDFIVHPGANPKRIAFMMHGAREMGLTADNGLNVSTPLGTMSEAAPYSYTYSGIETRHNEVESGFVLDGNTVRFSIGEYDRTQTLVIDPRRVWATYFGYNQEASNLKTAIDLLGNVLMSGGTAATNLPEVTGVLQKRRKARMDGFVAKFNDLGTFLWSTYFGGSGDDRVTGVCTDEIGNVYACGETGSEINTLPQLLGVGSAPWGDPDSLGVTNGFVLGLTPNGAWIDHWFLYGRNEDAVNDIAFRNDKLAIVGTSRSVRVCEQVGSPYSHNDSNNYRNQDVFVAQFSRNATQVNRWKGDWLSFIGGEWDDQGVAVAIDAQGGVYVGATTQGFNIQVTDGTFMGDSGDFYVGKFSGNATIATHNWGSMVGGNSVDVLLDLVVDEAGGVVAVGSTRSENFPFKNALSTAREGDYNYDGFIRKYSTIDGMVQWSTVIGGKSHDFVHSVAVDLSNRFWICGSSAHTVTLDPPDMPVTTGAFQTTLFNTGNWGVSTGYFGQISADGQTLMYGSYYGAPLIILCHQEVVQVSSKTMTTSAIARPLLSHVTPMEIS